MPPKAQVSASRGRGRPARVAVLEPIVAMTTTSTTTTPRKRGRPSKADAAEIVAEPPKKRGRPSKAKAEEAAEAVQDALKRGRRSLAVTEAVAEAVADVPTKRAGRPRKDVVAVEDAAVPKARGRPRKDAAIVEVFSAPKARGRPRKSDVVAPSLEAPKRRGRPPKNASAPVSRAVPTVRAVKTVSRINPKMRSRLRTRVAPVAAIREEIAPVVKRRRGPNKTVAEAPAPKKTAGRKAASAGITKAAPKVVAPRKRRGYTTIEVPDKFVDLVKLVIEEQLEIDAAGAAAAGEDTAGEDTAEEEVDAETAEGQLENENAASDEDQLVLEMEAPEGDGPVDPDVEADYGSVPESDEEDANNDDANNDDANNDSQDSTDEEEDKDAIDAITEDLSGAVDGAADDLTVDYDASSRLDITHTHDTFTDDVDMGTSDLGAQVNAASAFAHPVETETETVTAVETVTSTTVQKTDYLREEEVREPYDAEYEDERIGIPWAGGKAPHQEKAAVNTYTW